MCIRDRYLIVLSRIEKLLGQKKLPESAIDGFVGAVKKQLEIVSDADKQILLKLPEASKLELSSIKDLPDLIKNALKDEARANTLLQFLRQPKFANLMNSDSHPSTKTYKAHTGQPHSQSANGLSSNTEAENIKESIPKSTDSKQGVSQKINV